MLSLRKKHLFNRRTLFFLILLFFGNMIWKKTEHFKTDVFFNNIFERELVSFRQQKPFFWLPPYNNDVMVYRQTRYDLYQKTQWNRTGPGELGRPVHLPEQEYKQAKERLPKTGGSFKVVSDMISLDRALPDPRSERCREVIYPKFNVTVTVVVTYCNDAASLILRTAHSVINRSPPEYLKEVLLINDHSDHKELGDLLEQEISVTWPDGLVRVIRTDQRRGVAGARMVGIENASGDVIVSFDGHVEVFPGWLEPLLARLDENPEVLICPTLGGIDAETFEARPGGDMVWDFSWDMMNRPSRPFSDLPNQPVKPYKSMASTGGAWAMMRKTFLDLGGYDKGMSAWGGEDFEMALRVWLCTRNGSVEMVPCSCIAHVFRKGPAPYHPTNETETDYTLRNFQRTAEIWMDEYKPLFYYKQPQLKKKNFGDISEMMKLRSKLRCRNFNWFLNTIATHKVIPNFQDILLFGQIESSSDSLCLDTLSADIGRPLGLYNCIDEAVHTQYFAYLPSTGQLMLRIEYCMKYDAGQQNKNPVLERCSSGNDQRWRYKQDTKEFVHSSGLCLDTSDPGRQKGGWHYVALVECNGGPSQQWIWREKDKPA